MAPWWKGAVVYHIYVRSFFDSDGDGHGDLAGVMAKLDYLKSLGVDAIWLSPIHPSPNRDWGYDVSDYDDVHPDYGSVEDFQALTKAAHGLGLKVLLDEVLAHTSDEHPWFTASRDEGPEGDKADWYVWADPADDGTAPNNWLSVFGGPAWAYQPARRQHYHHKFLRQQPKLNWRQPQAKAAALKVLDTWLTRGADGFRLDVANAFLHDGALRDNPPIPAADRDRAAWAHASDMQRHLFDANLPETIPLLDEVRRRVEAHGADGFVFGEFSY
jgi:alpha-glucosidase